MLGWRSLLKEVIFILIVVIFGGCVPKINYQAPINISERYYIVKEPEDRDKKILFDNYITAVGENRGILGILIGGYYYKIKDYSLAKSYLEKFKSFSANPYLEVARDVWLKDIMVKEDGLGKYITDISGIDQKYKGTEGYNFFYKYFCGGSSGEFVECFNQKYGIEKKQNEIEKKGLDSGSSLETQDVKSVNTQAPEENIVFPENVELYVEQGSFDTDFVKGVIVSVETKNLPLSIKTGIPAEGYYLNVTNNTLDIIQEADSKTVSLIPDYKSVLDVVGTDALLNKSAKVYIIAGDGFRKEGEYLKSIFDEIGTQTILFGFDTKEIRFEYRYDEMYYGNDNISFVTIGKEKDILEYVPFIKFTATNPDNVTIFAVTDLFSGKEISSDYIKYFKDIRLGSFFNSLTDEEDRKFNKRFEDYYGKIPEFDAYLGRMVAQSIIEAPMELGVKFESKFIQIHKDGVVDLLGGWYD